MNLPSQWNSARTYYDANKAALKMCSRCRIEPDALGHYILICVAEPTLAWSGNQWTPRDRSEAQAANWRTQDAARTGAAEAHLTVTG